jgi:acetyltransferase-like isoleucine patch superfamily enzyme
MNEQVDGVYVVLSWWPALWLGVAVALATLLHWPHAMWLAMAWLVLVPPLLCRFIDRCWPVVGSHHVRSPAARRWWFLQQLQMPFNRLPVFEELLRLIPGLYQAWLVLWGSRVSLLCMVAPNVVITDRQLLTIGTGAILGNGCLLGAHLVVIEPQWTITIARITIGRGAVIGARAALAPGVDVADHQMVTVMSPMPPFSSWHDGRRHLKVRDG